MDFDWLFNLLVHNESIDRQRLQQSYAKIAGQLTYWLVVVMFVTAAAKVLSWSLFAGWMESLITYLPRLFASVVIVLVAFSFGGFIRATH